MTISILGPAQTAVLTGAEKTTREMDKVQTAIGTGRKHDSYGELGGASASFSAAESAKALAESKGYNALFTRPVLNASASLARTLTRLADQGYEMATEVNNDGLEGFDVQGQSTILLNQTMDMMNNKISGLSITSGSASDKLAWDKTNLQDPATYNLDATDDVAIPQGYQGDVHRMSFELGEQKFDITMTGSELGPQRLVRAYHIMATADPNAADYKTRIQEAVRVFGQAKTDMRNIEARLGLVTKHIEDARISAKQTEFESTNFMQDINGTNNLETIPVMMALATHLRASYSVLAKDAELTRELMSVVDRG